MFHSSSRTADKFAEEYDRHGDSYTENATSESLKKVFDNVQGNVSMQELDGLQITSGKRWLQRLCTWSGKVGTSRNVLRSGTNMLQSQVFSHLADLAMSIGHFRVSPCLCFKTSLTSHFKPFC